VKNLILFSVLFQVSHLQKLETDSWYTCKAGMFSCIPPFAKVNSKTVLEFHLHVQHCLKLAPMEVRLLTRQYLACSFLRFSFWRMNPHWVLDMKG
jgi:hypothetical protein